MLFLHQNLNHILGIIGILRILGQITFNSFLLPMTYFSIIKLQSLPSYSFILGFWGKLQEPLSLVAKVSFRLKEPPFTWMSIFTARNIHVTALVEMKINGILQQWIPWLFHFLLFVASFNLEISREKVYFDLIQLYQKQHCLNPSEKNPSLKRGCGII